MASIRLRNLVLTPQNSSSNPKVSSLMVRYPCMREHLKAKRNIGWLNLKVKCFNSEDIDYPKPSEVPWKKEPCNSVNLIGVVAAPVEMKYFPSGKVLAWTRLAVKKTATQTSWYIITFCTIFLFLLEY